VMCDLTSHGANPAARWRRLVVSSCGRVDRRSGRTRFATKRGKHACEQLADGAPRRKHKSSSLGAVAQTAGAGATQQRPRGVDAIAAHARFGLTGFASRALALPRIRSSRLALARPPEARPALRF
jgi:hypothetical protein